MITIFIVLFVGGFFYGLFEGNYKMFWLLRSVLSGCFFMLFFISVPVMIICDWLERRECK